MTKHQEYLDEQGFLDETSEIRLPEETEGGYLDETSEIHLPKGKESGFLDETSEIHLPKGEESGYLDETSEIHLPKGKESGYLDETSEIHLPKGKESGFLDETSEIPLLKGEESGYLDETSEIHLPKGEESGYLDETSEIRLPEETEGGFLDAEEDPEDQDDSVLMAEDEIRDDTESRDDTEIRDDTEVVNEQHDMLPDEEETGRDKSGSEGRILNFIMAGLAAAIAITAIVFGYRYFGIRQVQAEEAAYAGLGAQMQTIGRLGGEDTSRMIAANRIRREEDAAREAAEIEAQRILAQKKAELASQAGSIVVDMALSSLQSDLKIKIRDTATYSLISGVPFRAEVRSPDGSITEYEDDDRDGIIYRTSVKAGTYTVRLLPLVDLEKLDSDEVTEDEEYKRLVQYKIPEAGQTVAVKEEIEYKKIDVADEIKTESEINVAAEDTAHNDTVVESEIQDTVEWTESTQIEVTEEPSASDDPTADQYEEVPKSAVPDPYNLAFSGLLHKNYRLLDEIITQETSEDMETEQASQEEAAPAEEVKEEPKSVSVVLDNTTLTAARGDNITLHVTVTWTDGTVNSDAQWTSSDQRVATVDTSGNVHIVGTGSCSITAARGVHSESCVITVPEENNTDDGQQEESQQPGEEQEETTQNAQDAQVVVNVSPISITMAPGKTQRLGVEVQNAENPSVIFTSSHQDIASVSADGTITANAEGEAIITVTSAQDQNVHTEVSVKVATSVDENAMLKDANGNQLYVWDAGVYREAFVRDYRNFETFYRKKGGVKTYSYTGWQTIDGRTYYYDKDGNPVTGRQTIQGVAYNFGTDGVLQANTQLGIDVSGWNGTINWQKVKEAGVSYAVIRCGYRGSSTGVLVRDSMFSANLQGASAAGIRTGVYFYSQAVTEAEAVEEASMVLELIRGYSLSLPVFLDVEASGGRGDKISAAQRTSVIKAFCQTIASSGYSAGVYANTNWFNEKINTSEITGYHIWLAQYAAAPTYTRTRYDIWQYTDRGKISGISGYVDMNQVFRSY